MSKQNRILKEPLPGDFHTVILQIKQTNKKNRLILGSDPDMTDKLKLSFWNISTTECADWLHTAAVIRNEIHAIK